MSNKGKDKIKGKIMNDCVIKETVLKVIESCRDEQHYDDVLEATLSVLWNAAIAKAYQAVSNLSSADGKIVVLCKDCKHSYADLGGLTCSHGLCVDSIVADNFYCADGERRE